jgi:hypothetical protein
MAAMIIHQTPSWTEFLDRWSKAWSLKPQSLLEGQGRWLVYLDPVLDTLMYCGPLADLTRTLLYYFHSALWCFPSYSHVTEQLHYYAVIKMHDQDSPFQSFSLKTSATPSKQTRLPPHFALPTHMAELAPIKFGQF